MKKIINLLKVNLIYGGVFLFPMIIFLLLIGKVHQSMVSLMTYLFPQWSQETFLAVMAHKMVIYSLIVLAFLLSGLLARTKIGRKLLKKIQGSLLYQLPGYTFLRETSAQASRLEELSNQKVVLVRFNDYWQLGFEVEKATETKQAAVYVPGSPNPWSGSVIIVESDRLQLSEMSYQEALAVLKKGGKRMFVSSSDVQHSEL